MKRLLLASPFLAVFVVAQQASGPQRNVGSAGPKKSTQSAGTPPSAARIGNNIVQVIDSLVAAGAAKGKGEYETKEEHESRQKAMAARYGQLTFLVPDAKFAYNADKGEMKLILFPLSYFVGDTTPPPLEEMLDLSTKLVGNSTYTGSNEYGAKALVHLGTFSSYGIAFSPPSSIPFKRGFYQESGADDAELTFPMGADQARALKPYLRVVLAGKLVEARVDKAWDMVPATLDVPYEIRRHGLFIPFVFEELRIVDIRFGKPIEVFSGNN
jgi:hypothetical protein